MDYFRIALKANDGTLGLKTTGLMFLTCFLRRMYIGKGKPYIKEKKPFMPKGLDLVLRNI